MPPAPGGSSRRSSGHGVCLQSGRHGFDSMGDFPGQVVPVANKMVLQCGQWLTKWYFSAASGSQNGTSVRPVAHKMVLQCGQWLTKWYFSAASGSQNGTSVRPVVHKMVLQCGQWLTKWYFSAADLGSSPWFIFQVKSHQWLTKWYFSAADLGSILVCAMLISPQSSYTNDSNNGTSVPTLPGAWQQSTGWSGVSIL